MASYPQTQNPLHEEHLQQGITDFRQKRFVDAERHFREALRLDPTSAPTHYALAIVLLAQNHSDEATSLLQQTVSLNANHAEAWYHLGNILRDTGKLDEAGQAFRHAIIANPKFGDAFNNLGNLYKSQGRLKEALACHLRANIINPRDAFYHNNLGSTFVATDHLDKAEDEFRHAVDLLPDYPEALNNLGNVIHMQGKAEDSIKLYRRALVLRPDYIEAMNNLANALKDENQNDEALTLYRRVATLSSDPDHRHNLGMSLLAMGHMREGWIEYESRWQSWQMAAARRNFTQPQWRGEAGEGRTLLIHAEQGFGDTIQFGRYATLAAERGWRVVFEVQPPLKRLMQSLMRVEVIAQGKTLPDFDMHCPTLSLPVAFDTIVENIPATIPYLSVSDTGIKAWGNRLPPKTNDKTQRIGLVWAGSPRLHSADLAATNRRRSLAPELLRPIFNVPNIQFASLQKGSAPAPAHFGLIDVINDCQDFADTAALIMNLDLVISVDTAVAHLAAALGKPVWLMNRYDNCWRWLQNRTDTPWYPSMRLLRQSAPGDWGSVVEKIHKDLSQAQQA